MAVAYKSMSQVKLDLQEIISNLDILEENVSTEPYLNALRAMTEELLTNLEKFPLEKLKSKLKQRKKRRKYKSLQLKESRILRNLGAQTVDSKTLVEHIKPVLVSHEAVTKSAQQNKVIKECQRFLKTFELLQQLHLVRGQNPSETYKLSFEFRQLKLIWNSLLQDKLQEQTSDDVKIQEEWNEVLFGPSEKIYFEEKPDLKDFIRKRQVWDSYIDNRHGSAIPIGWIIPLLEANKEWRSYLQPVTYPTN